MHEWGGQGFVRGCGKELLRGRGDKREEMAGASIYYMCFQVFMGHSKLENRKRESIISKAPLEWKDKNDT